MFYNQDKVISFKKTKEEFGGLSNMAAGYPLKFRHGVGTQHVRTSEALYQCLKFPYSPSIQNDILEEKSPMAAKMVAKKNSDSIHEDWMSVRLEIMEYCIYMKLYTNLMFLFLLAKTEDKPIVEVSTKDKFWGATPVKMFPKLLEGENQLGKILSSVRDSVFSGEHSLEETLKPPRITFPVALLGAEMNPVKCNYL